MTDAAGNDGPVTSQAYTLDQTAPSVVSVLISDTALKIGDTATVTITFSEAVANFSNDDVSVANGILGTLATRPAPPPSSRSVRPTKRHPEPCRRTRVSCSTRGDPIETG